MTANATAVRRTPRQLLAAIVGVVFPLAGVLGFIPGVTTNHERASPRPAHRAARSPARPRSPIPGSRAEAEAPSRGAGRRRHQRPAPP
jgi:hypothetical protein